MLCSRSVLFMQKRLVCPVAVVGSAFLSSRTSSSSPILSQNSASAQPQLSSSSSGSFGFLRRSTTAAATQAGLVRGPSFSATSTNHMMQQQYRSLVIETNETPNPDSLRFFSMDLSFLPEGQSMDMPNEGHGYKSPLAVILFKLNGVKSLYFADEYITVTKEAEADWAEVSVLVKEAIAQFAESGVSILSAEGEEEILPTNWDTDAHDDDSEVVLAIKELLASRIRPMVQGDGGNVRFIGFDAEDGLVFVMLEGACKTCPSSGQTLKFGIERMLMHWIPEVTEVQEVDEEFASDYKRQQLEMIAKREKEDAAISSGCRR